MSSKTLSDNDALALSGRTLPQTGVTMPTVGSFDYRADVLRLANRLSALGRAGLTGLVESTPTGVGVEVTGGAVTLAGAAVRYAGETVDLAALGDGTAYVWLANVGGTPTAQAGADWPATAHLKLAEVPIVGGVIDDAAILDWRTAALFTIA